MRAEVTMSQLWWNHSLMRFFFRDQAKNTLEEFVHATDDVSEVLEKIEDYALENDYDLDEIEDIFYNESVRDIADMMGIELNEEDEDDESED